MEDALPSSPPLVPTRPRLTRKRTRASELSISCPSSDPAFFSSDDLDDEGAENYNGDRPRKKVQWDGPWWGRGETVEGGVSARTRAASSNSRKKTFTRNLDSGVWMASDDSEATVPDNDLVLPVASSVVVLEPTPTTKRQRSEVETIVERRILDAVDNPPAHVDLSGLHLEFLDGELLLPLQTLVAPAPHLDAAGSSSPRTYAPLTPDIHLYLSNNELTYLPPRLFDLEHLTVLSLRNNNLSELPSSIGRLRNLHTLNITGNNLRYLPASLIPLWSGSNGTLQHFERWSNPLINPVASTEESWKHGQADLQLFMPQKDDSGDGNEDDQAKAEAWNPRLVNWIRIIRAKLNERWKHHGGDEASRWHKDVWSLPIIVASTPVIYFDATGVPLSGLPISEMTDAQIVAGLDQEESTPLASMCTPSLFEHCLRICTRSSDLPQLASMMPAGTASTVLNGLKAAETYAGEGGRTCSRCGRTYVLARAEWLDFIFCVRDMDPLRSPATRRINYDEIMVPYINRVCSWACAEPLKE